MLIKYKETSLISFGISNGHSEPLSPILFDLILEKAISAVHTMPSGTIYNRLSQNLAYADDIVITVRSKAALAGTFEEFERAVNELGLGVNEEKKTLSIC